MIALQAVLHVINLRYNKQFQIDTVNEQRKLGYVSQLAKDISAKKDIDLFNMSGFILKKIKSFQQNMLVFNIRRIKTSTFIEMATYLLSIAFQISLIF